ncbi:MAG: tRNA dihydrouridine synthase DusB [Pseudogulbenkiania sp.]|nr:tRNA dihydrouridine synthase DusB [Pseudogulbenkiania sp.]
MRIGPYTLKNRLIVAPMAGVTDRPFRMLCKRLGAGMAVSEMITSNKALWTTAKTLRRANHDGEVEPISVQIAGADPVQMAEAARLNVEQGAQIIDINMGCPAKKVCNVAAGSALLRDEALVRRILEAVVKAVDVPVTLKTRTGWSREHKTALRVARLAEDCGIAALALHGRTREDMYRGAAEYDTIRAVRQAISIPLIANGDIDSPERARHVLAHTGADAIMIGRAAQGRPWIFREIQYYLDTGATLPPPAVAEIRQLLLEHLDELYGFYGEYSGCRIARKHIAWYTRGLRGSNEFRQAMYRLEDTAQQRTAVAGYFDMLAGESERLEYVEAAADGDETLAG